MKKVLVISYYWPPVGGAGVQRWVKQVKYLPQFGWEPIVYTPLNPDLSVVDESLLDDVSPALTIWKTPIWEPYNAYRKLFGRKPKEAVNHGLISEGKKGGLAQSVGAFIRANFFIPDARRFWIKPSVSFLLKQLQHTPVDAIISTGPPHSMHLIALRLHQKTGIPWIADFRDPWRLNDVYDRLPFTALADAQHRKLEMKVLKSATAVVTVSWQWAQHLQQLSQRFIQVITNGYDTTDFPASTTLKGEYFTLYHAGSLYADRNPTALWQVLAHWMQQDPQLKTFLRIRFSGKVDHSILHSIREAGLADVLQYDDYIPHAEVLKGLQEAAVLLLILSDSPDAYGRIPGKIFEYLAAARPVLGMGTPDGDSSRILKEAGVGQCFTPQQTDEMAAHLKGWFQNWLDGKALPHPPGLEKYTRLACSRQFAQLLDSIHRG